MAEDEEDIDWTTVMKRRKKNGKKLREDYLDKERQTLLS